MHVKFQTQDGDLLLPGVERLFTDDEQRLLAGLTLTETCFDRVDFRNADL